MVEFEKDAHGGPHGNGGLGVDAVEVIDDHDQMAFGFAQEKSNYVRKESLEIDGAGLLGFHYCGGSVLTGFPQKQGFKGFEIAFLEVCAQCEKQGNRISCNREPSEPIGLEKVKRVGLAIKRASQWNT